MRRLLFFVVSVSLVSPCGAGIIIVGDDGPADLNNIELVISAPNVGPAAGTSSVRPSSSSSDLASDQPFYYELRDDEIRGDFWYGSSTYIGDGVYRDTFGGYLENTTDYELYDVGLTLPFFLYPPWSRSFSYDNSDHTWRLASWWARTYGVEGQDELLSMDRSITDAPLGIEFDGIHASVSETDEVTLIFFGDLSPGERAYRKFNFYRKGFSEYKWVGVTVTTSPHGPVVADGLTIVGPGRAAANYWTGFKAIAHYENHISRDVSPVTRWWVDPNNIATIHGGTLTIADLNEPQQITIYAEYSREEITLQAQLAVEIYIHDAPVVLHVPSEYPTIQAAIEAAVDTDEVVVSPGRYTGEGNRDVRFLGKAITVRSIDPNDPEIVRSTIIDCEASEFNHHRGFFFDAGEASSSVLAGLTVTNGYAESGGAIYCLESSPTITDCMLVHNSAEVGGAIMCEGSEWEIWPCEPNIIDCTIRENSARRGGGAACDDARPTFAGCTFAANTAEDNGGGMYNESLSSPTLSDCVFTDNRSLSSRRFSGGGGMYNYESSSPMLTRCRFARNTSIGGGGGMMTFTVSGPTATPTLIDCTFVANAAEHGGGMEYQRNSEPDLTGCSFVRNSAASLGGAIYNDASPHSGSAKPKIRDCLFVDNLAESGGGVANSYRPEPNFTRCTFIRNSASSFGGAVLHLAGPSNLEECIFSENSAGERGGGMDNRGEATLTNCIFTGNSAVECGGAMSNNDSDVNLVNCTFRGNSARDGRALAFDSAKQAWPSSVQIANSILWEDTSTIWNNDGSAITITYSDIASGWPGEGNINDEPQFALSSDCHLRADSPCIDAGTNTPPILLPENDMEGNWRVLDGDGDGNAVVDMGTYEHDADYPAIAVSAERFFFVGGRENTRMLALRGCGNNTLNWQILADCAWLDVQPASGVSTNRAAEVTVIVDANGLTPGSYRCTLTVVDEQGVNRPRVVTVELVVPRILRVPEEYETIQSAIDAAEGFDNVVVAPGIYTGDGNRDIDFRGKTITVRSIDPGDPNAVAATIIDCNATEEDLHRGFHFHRGESTESILDGLTITNGYAPKEYEWIPWPFPGYFRSFSYGGAIYCEPDDLVKRDSGPTIQNCIITGNSTALDSDINLGGGICGSKGPITNCIVRDNSALRGGGLYGCDGPIRNCIITDNTSRDGGGIMCLGSDCTITNCVVAGNHGYWVGGGICCTNCEVRIRNCTIVDNSAYIGGGVCCTDYGATAINQSILWANEAEFGPEIALIGEWFTATSEKVIDLSAERTTVGVWYSCIRGGTWDVSVGSGCTLGWGMGNIEDDPCFVDYGRWGQQQEPNTVTELNSPETIWLVGDYHLLPGSPCIDAGDRFYRPEPRERDLDGNPRVTDGDNNGWYVIDMGAYEFFWPPVACRMRFTPRALNFRSRGKWLKAHLIMPEYVGIDDIDPDWGLRLIDRFWIPCDYMNVFVNGEDLVEIEAGFDRADFCRFGPFDGVVTVQGLLTTGQPFGGTDMIRIVDRSFEYLANLSDYWLVGGCGEPNWCGGFDLNQDSTVDFMDFALFDGCCIDVVNK